MSAPELGAYEGGQDDAAVARWEASRSRSRPALVLTGSAGQAPARRAPSVRGRSPLSQEGHRGGSCSTVVIDLVGNRHLGQSVGEIEDLLPLAGEGALRPITAGSRTSASAEAQSVAIATALGDTSYDGTPSRGTTTCSARSSRAGGVVSHRASMRTASLTLASWLPASTATGQGRSGPALARSAAPSGARQAFEEVTRPFSPSP